MKSVALLGNIANNFYREGSLLGRASDITVTLFVGPAENVPNTARPSSDPGSECQDTKRLTIRETARPLFGIRPQHLFLPRALWCLDPNVDLGALSALESADLVFLSGPEVVLGNILRTPFVIRPTGSDLTVSPSLSFGEYEELRGRQGSAFISRMQARLRWTLRRAFFKRAYRRAVAIAAAGIELFERPLEVIGVDRRRLLTRIPLAVDSGTFKRIGDWSELLPTDVKADDFMVFFPSRMMIKDSLVHQKTGQWKASDVGIRGFKAFLDSLQPREQRRCWLLIPDRTLSDDLKIVKELIQNLRISGNVLWLKGADQTGLTREEMLPLYSTVSATMDQFGAGWSGSVLVEAMACESPVITHLSGTWIAANGNPPVLLAETANDVASQLRKLHTNRAIARTLGREARDWVKIWHGEEAIVAAYKKLFKELDRLQSSV